MKSNIQKSLGMVALALAALPFAAHAQASNNGLFGVLNRAHDLVNRLLPFVITLTLLVFLWGVFKFVLSGADMESRKQARGFILWGLIALAIMVSVWGLVNLLIRTVGIDNTPPPVPQPVGNVR